MFSQRLPPLRSRSLFLPRFKLWGQLVRPPELQQWVVSSGLWPLWILYDFIRRTTCSGDFLALGGPGSQTQSPSAIVASTVQAADCSKEKTLQAASCLTGGEAPALAESPLIPSGTLKESTQRSKLVMAPSIDAASPMR